MGSEMCIRDSAHIESNNSIVIWQPTTRTMRANIACVIISESDKWSKVDSFSDLNISYYFGIECCAKVKVEWFKGFHVH